MNRSIGNKKRCDCCQSKQHYDKTDEAYGTVKLTFITHSFSWERKCCSFSLISLTRLLIRSKADAACGTCTDSQRDNSSWAGLRCGGASAVVSALVAVYIRKCADRQAQAQYDYQNKRNKLFYFFTFLEIIFCAPEHTRGSPRIFLKGLSLSWKESDKGMPLSARNIDFSSAWGMRRKRKRNPFIFGIIIAPRLSFVNIFPTEYSMSCRFYANTEAV